MAPPSLSLEPGALGGRERKQKNAKPDPSTDRFAGSSSDGQAGNPPFTLLNAPNKHTLQPYVTGSSILGIKFKDGILLAADTLGSYGSTLRYKSVERLKPVGKYSVIGASGEISDFIYINTLLEELITIDVTYDDGYELSPSDIHSYLTRVMYNRRNKFDPLWNNLVIGGVKDGRSFLGTVSSIGVNYTGNFVATGLGNHLAIPILRAEHTDDITEEEGILLLEKCLRVLYYRDKSALNKIQIAKIRESGVEISKPYALSSEWSYKFFENPAQGAEGSW